MALVDFSVLPWYYFTLLEGDRDRDIVCGLGDMVKGTRTEVQNDTGMDRETETGTVGLGQGNRDRDIVCGLGTRLQRDMQEKGTEGKGQMHSDKVKGTTMVLVHPT